MSTTRTSADLVVKILEILINLPEGQAPEVEESARVQGNLPSLFLQLAAEEIVYVSDIEKIPDAWFLALAKIAAYELRSQFGVTGELETVLAKGYDEGVKSIRVMTRGRPTFEPLKTLSF